MIDLIYKKREKLAKEVEELEDDIADLEEELSKKTLKLEVYDEIIDETESDTEPKPITEDVGEVVTVSENHYGNI